MIRSPPFPFVGQASEASATLTVTQEQLSLSENPTAGPEIPKECCGQTLFGCFSCTVHFRYLLFNNIPLVQSQTKEGMSLGVFLPCARHK